MRYNCKFTWRASENIHDFYEVVRKLSSVDHSHTDWVESTVGVYSIDGDLKSHLVWLAEVLDVTTLEINRIE